MAGIVSEESGVGKSVEGISSGQRCQSGEALAEWRSSEQVENGITSTSPPYWDTGDEDDDGPKPSDLYGRYTWTIEKFSQITKRELRSNAFDVGGFKWYILIYPQGCDVCNHLSLFLCVANHDKLLPGWSHFAQFTIAVVNKDPKKSKYSDTLHRFWKKEHDWGWKKFMELSKVYDGFVDSSDNLIIKAQVQVISFFAFWREIDQTSRCEMSREKTDVILKVVVKHFFIEKEVTSTLVMDSLYSGLKALEGQTMCKKGRVKLLDAEEIPAPIVHVEKDMFVLVDDVLLLLERAAIEPLPPKDEKGPQNRTKDGNSGEDFNKDSIERDERRLTELGRRTLEIFVLAHIFSNKIEVAYQEAVAFKRQEELIREEAESDQKAKRGVNEREKKSKKKQAKQKRNSRKGKDKGREERTTVSVHDKILEDNSVDEKKDSNMEEAQTMSEKPDAMEDVSDVSDSVDGVAEMLQPDSEDRDATPVNWDTDASEVHPPTEASNNGIGGVSSIQNGMSEKRSSSVIDDSSSTCSTDSLPSVVMNDPYKGNSFSNYKVQKSPSKGKNRGKASCDVGIWTNEIGSQSSGSAADAGDINDESGSGKVGESESEGSVVCLQDRLKWAEQHVVRKEEEVLSLEKKPSIKDQVEIETPVDNESLQKEKISVVPPSPISPTRNLSSSVQMKLEHKTSATVDPFHVRKTSSSSSQQTDKDPSSPFTSASHVTTVSKTEIQKTSTPRLTERSMVQVPMMSRPSSAPLVPGPRPTAPVASMVQTAPLLARSVSAVGRLGPDPSPATHSYVPQSYRNAIMGNPVASNAASLTHSSSSSSGVNPSPGYCQPSSLVSSPIFLSQSSDRMDSNAGHSGVPFGMITRDVLQNGPQWIDSSQRESSRNMHYDQPYGLNDVQNHDLYRPVHSRSMGNMSTEFSACTSGRQNQGLLVDEFPHLDIINDLLDDEHGIGKTTRASSVFHSLNNGPQSLNRQLTFPGDWGANDDLGSSTSSCRFERSQSYHHDHGFQRGYNSSGGHFDSVRDYIPQQMSSVPYVNGQVDGLIPNQWQVAGSDLLYLGMRNTENDGYAYYPDYSNMACGVNGYTVFRPSNGP
ncbi:TNF receptor-associated factor homolog 1a-like isoform X2 [Gastrolobium bilobum]|uniref:TNF receptor-associated factor homolog 1a-like isoform X2 n=1 Tax=Gastrolobium bilobum TaxID=150636 RepID=UPI002AB05B3D|nr:TNF receptor-associated factor homolog 1a-like isoform X2 [Gastrolobium bilobum]